MEHLRNEYAGERIFVVGNGPSLSETPMGRLDDEYTFAMNKISKIYDETDWRPDFYYTHWMIDEENEGGTAFVWKKHKERYTANHDDVYYFNRCRLLNNEGASISFENDFHDADFDEIASMPMEKLESYWSDDITEVVYTYHSMYPVLQIVNYLGFDEVYFIGCDMGMGYYSPHMVFDSGMDPYKYEGGKVSYFKDSIRKGPFVRSMVNGIAFKLVQLGGGFRVFDSGMDPQEYVGEKLSYFKDSIRKGPFVRSMVNGVAFKLVTSAKRLLNKVTPDETHFLEDYYKEPHDMRPHNNQILKSHKAADRLLSARGVEVYNATLGGELEVHPRVDLVEVLEKHRPTEER